MSHSIIHHNRGDFYVLPDYLAVGKASRRLPLTLQLAFYRWPPPTLYLSP